MAAKMEIVRKCLENIVSAGAEGVALVSRSGIPVDSILPEDATSETFAAMCATVFGAAEVACSEVKLEMPEEISITGAGFVLLLVSFNEGTRLVAYTHNMNRKGEILAVMKLGAKELETLIF
ncbi:MAG: roadblock/LC7 domain-containing protein [Thermoplasmata archaeon]